MSQQLKRISLLIREEQHEQVLASDLNLSGLVRDLLDDYFSHHKITISVSEETRKLYDQIVSNTASSDSDVEKYLRRALKEMLHDRIDAMKQLEKTID